ncbi:hypothetical protein [Quadrisphaera setariae]|uniref:Uncharacterized protein n=1 Tax=Quadrisphaera setariae TaxID=2593304 RepID=A0A5C8Z596_9ACTN|nr:hypothetical protein [Quadrisphaera setariae]TXR52459.1 hypothetical protein FMM08_19905 [Quadrisphaera setariae]
MREGHGYRQEFLLALRQIAEEEGSRDPSAPELVACGAFGERDVVVLYREFDGGPILGRRYNLQLHVSLFAPTPPPPVLAEIVFWDDLWDPTGRGEVLDVGWADGLGAERRLIQWVGAAERLEA